MLVGNDWSCLVNGHPLRTAAKPYESVVTKLRFAFVLRVWTETATTGHPNQPALRGSLESVESKQIHYFSSFNQIGEILQQVTGWQIEIDPGQPGKEPNM